MPAYYRQSLANFAIEQPEAIVGILHTRYAEDGFAQQYMTQSRAWAELIPLLQREMSDLIRLVSGAGDWSVLIEFPLYRLQRRIDIILITTSIIVIEAKVGETRFLSGDERQVEEYCLDLRDFHEGSRGELLFPVLWATHAVLEPIARLAPIDLVAPVSRVGREGLAGLIAAISSGERTTVPPTEWDQSVYRPVPTVIQAATSIFAGHDVRQIAQADASNLREAASRVVDLISWAKVNHKQTLIFLTGVPGSGKTLAGLQAVHDAVATGAEHKGDVVYLSGNTPLVIVLREALARSEYARCRGGSREGNLADIRRAVRARIQHVNDFLKQALKGASSDAPHEHAIVFDEAQRAWDEKQGLKKFSRTASEPALLLEVMERCKDWCACVCLIGEGQEINSGERGVLGWADALRNVKGERRWVVIGPADVVSSQFTSYLHSGGIPRHVDIRTDESLQLKVPLRSFRSPTLNEWVSFVLAGNATSAAEIAAKIAYPIKMTRSLDDARAWLRDVTRGQRRCGLLASSGARRLRADGLGEILKATDGMDIAHWYLNPPGDIRSSLALEVPANEYTCQGLELDFSALCWGGDLLRRSEDPGWVVRRLNGASWQNVNDLTRRQFVENSYRVLLTRAREGLMIWIPKGEAHDKTREPESLDVTAKFVLSCGAEEYIVS